MVVLLHGFGSHMGDLAGLCQTLGTSDYVYACPNGPIRMPSNLGSAGFAWMYFSQGAESQEAEAAEEQLAAFLEEVSELYRVPPGQVALGGFSQGAMLTYRWGLANPHLFRGLFALSGKLSKPATLKTRLPAGRTQSVFIAHGDADPLISIQEARDARRFLQSEGYEPEYREYAMAHEVSEAEAADLARWLRTVLPTAGEPA